MLNLPYPPEEPDTALLDRIRKGDEAALTVLYRRYVAQIYRFVLAQVRNVADAEDITSETFARMLHGLGQFRGEASFKNWLYQIARNAVRNYRRAAHYRLSVPLSHSIAANEAEAVGDDESTGDPLEQEGVLALLKPLPPRYRQILELRFLLGRTLEEVASEMQITVTNAKVLQHRALRKAAVVLAATVESAATSADQTLPARDIAAQQVTAQNVMEEKSGGD